ncbi:hypothetical protein [uncultured Nitrospira sp.]|uniref:hypothetical protein n=1 Tax=uncultured Nitrospira sp. TaxID=157176 RepID=UPI0031406DA4
MCILSATASDSFSLIWLPGFVPEAEALLFRQKDPKPLALGVMRKMPSILAESSGGQTRLPQTVPAWLPNSAPRLGHAEWADPVLIQAMRFQTTFLNCSLQQAGSSKLNKVFSV